MSGLDWLMIALYFGLLLGLTWWSVLRNRNTADDYFLASRDLGWVVVGASIFASNIGSEHLVGLAGAGATSGVALAHYELHAWCLLVLGWVLVPFYLRSRVYTMPEFLERRYSATARWVLSLISLVAYVLTKMAVGIFAGGVVFGTLLPEMQLQVGGTVLNSFWIGSVLVVVMTGLYTIVGGMRAVAYTEAVQTAVLVLGSLLLTVFGLSRLGGWDELRTVLGSEMFNLWKPLTPAGVEAPGFLSRRRDGWPGISIRTIHGSACSSARRLSDSGIGAPTSTSSSARSERRTNAKHAGARSSRRSPSCFRSSSSSFPA